MQVSKRTTESRHEIVRQPIQFVAQTSAIFGYFGPGPKNEGQWTNKTFISFYQ